MKEIYAEYLESSFLDYKNEEHKIIVCAICVVHIILKKVRK